MKQLIVFNIKYIEYDLNYIGAVVIYQYVKNNAPQTYLTEQASMLHILCDFKTNGLIVESFPCEYIMWRPARQSYVTAKIIDAFEWLFFVRFLPKKFIQSTEIKQYKVIKIQAFLLY